MSTFITHYKHNEYNIPNKTNDPRITLQQPYNSIPWFVLNDGYFSSKPSISSIFLVKALARDFSSIIAPVKHMISKQILAILYTSRSRSKAFLYFCVVVGGEFAKEQGLRQRGLLGTSQSTSSHPFDGRLNLYKILKWKYKAAEYFYSTQKKRFPPLG